MERLRLLAELMTILSGEVSGDQLRSLVRLHPDRLEVTCAPPTARDCAKTLIEINNSVGPRALSGQIRMDHLFALTAPVAAAIREDPDTFAVHELYLHLQQYRPNPSAL